MRIVFMGTPEISRDVLETVSSKYDVVGVFCQPDKPVGRKQIITPPPVKVFAEEAGLSVFQPKGFRNGKATQIIRELDPDLVLVIAYGKILPQEVLDIPRLGCINIHASLLPKYRGAAPVQRSIINGETVTGITIMNMSAEMDAGDILAQKEVVIEPDDNEASLFSKIGETSCSFILEVLPQIEARTLTPVKQDEKLVTYAPPLEKNEGFFTFNKDGKDIVNLIRGMSVWPVAFFSYDGKKVKVEEASYEERSGAAGEVLSLKPLTVAAGTGAVVLRKLIPEGGKPMDGTAWANGRRLRVGDVINTDNEC